MTTAVVPPGARVHAVLLGVVLAIGSIVALQATWLDLGRIAVRHEESQYILGVPLAALWAGAFWWSRTHPGPQRGHLLGPVMIALGWLAVWVGDDRALQSVWHFGAVLALVGAAVTALGTEVLRRAWPALLMLLFLIPLPGRVRSEIAIPLQEVAARVTQFVLEIGGAPISRSGNVLEINGQVVGVAEACNGMRMLMALVLISWLFVFTRPLRWWVRLAVIVISPLTAIVCNVLRIVPTVLMYGYAPGWAADLFHDYAGWAMALLAFVLLMDGVFLLEWAGIPMYDRTRERRRGGSPGEASA